MVLDGTVFGLLLILCTGLTAFVYMWFTTPKPRKQNGAKPAGGDSKPGR